MSTLYPGPHTIVSKLTSQPIGRRDFEDKSGHPKEVVNREKGVVPQIWALEDAGDGLFRLLIRESPTTAIDKKIYALVMGEDGAVSWSLNRQPQHGDNVFTIEKGEEGGWVLPSEVPETQVPFVMV